MAERGDKLLMVLEYNIPGYLSEDRKDKTHPVCPTEPGTDALSLLPSNRSLEDCAWASEGLRSARAWGLCRMTSFGG